MGDAVLDNKLREIFKSKEEIFQGKIIKVERWKVELPNKKEATREVVLHNGAAAVIPLDDEGNVTLVRQHRVVIDTFTWEIPAGKLDSKDEEGLVCAKRELEEETGLKAEKWDFLNKIITTPGFCTEKISVYLARGLSQHEMHPDADEFLNHKKVKLDEAIDMIFSGELTDSKTCLGLLMAKEFISREEKSKL